MTFIIFFSFFLKKFEKVEKNWNHLHKIFVTMYSICYTRAPSIALQSILKIDSMQFPVFLQMSDGFRTIASD